MNLSNTKDEFLELMKIVKEYIILNKDYTLLQITEKLSQLLASLLLVLILLGIGLSTLLFLMFSGAYALAPFVGGLSWSALIFACVSILIMVVFYLNKTRWLLSPIIRFVSALLIEGTSAERKANTKAEAEQEMKAAQKNSMNSSKNNNETDEQMRYDQTANASNSTNAQREPSIRVVPIGTIPSSDRNTITPTGSSSIKKSKK
ncbi:MAG: hypothetical protein WCR36_05805 [Bacteroidaceae bacterium]